MFSNNTHISQPVVILVFKTNATEKLDQNLVYTLFQKMKGIKYWNFDFEDEDNIFRVESLGISAEKVIQKLATIGIDAIELMD